MIFLACLTKGPVGLYPLAFPIIYAVSSQKNHWRPAIYGLTILLSGLIFSGTLLFFYPPANYFLTNYFHGQVVLSLLKKREQGHQNWAAHFYLLRILAINILPHLAVITTLYATCVLKKLEWHLSDQVKRMSLLTFLTAISCTMPLLVSIKQADYYLMCATPFIGLFFALVCVETFSELSKRIQFIPHVLFPALCIVFIALMTFTLIFPTSDGMFRITGKISKYIPPYSSVYLPKEIAMNSGIHTSFQRYSKLSIAYDPHETKYLYFDNPENNILDSVRQTGKYKIITLEDKATLAILLP